MAWRCSPRSRSSPSARSAWVPAPVGLVHLHDLAALRMNAALQSIPTHRTPMAVVSSVVMAFATAWSVASTADWTAHDFVDAVTAATRDMHDPGGLERRPGSEVPVRLIDRIGELPAMVHLSADDAFDILWNGAFVLESVPAALWCFLSSPQDFEHVVVPAVNQGRDADTVAAMAGTLAGATVGASRIPDRWKDDLEDRQRLESIADALLGLAKLP